MKIFPYLLSFCGFCIFYICNTDWVDELIENYLGSEYEDVAPFISSVTAGTEEFDQIVQEFSKSKLSKWWPSISVVLTLTLFISFFTLLSSNSSQSRRVFDKVLLFLSRKTRTNKEEIQTIVSEFLEKRLEQLHGIKQDDVPVKLLWKGGTIMESSVHCNIRSDPKLRHMHHHLLQSKLLFKPSDSGGGESVTPIPSINDTSTAKKMAEIRKLLESEEELSDYVNKTEQKKEYDGDRSLYSLIREAPNLKNDITKPEDRIKKLNEKYDMLSKHKEDQSPKDEPGIDLDGVPDEKLMNRIRLLESRLRLEELKNKHWISRMSRAEGILQQLNKQVERIEETRPMGTLTETLKITSTVTNWPQSPHSRRNLHYTVVNQYPQFSIQPSAVSLTELIRKEVGLPAFQNFGKSSFHLSPTPQIPALPSPSVPIPQSSFFSKFLCR